MNCPSCNNDTNTKQGRKLQSGSVWRQRRQCKKCGVVYLAEVIYDLTN